LGALLIKKEMTMDIKGVEVKVDKIPVACSNCGYTGSAVIPKGTPLTLIPCTQCSQYTLCKAPSVKEEEAE
jgi:transcription elongation factor Elf1